MSENNNGKLVSWFKEHPTKAFLVLFLVLIPLILLILFGSNFNRNGKRFYFDTDSNGDKIYLYNKNIASKKTINKYFDEFEVKLKKVSESKTKDEDDKEVIVEYGRFEFDLNYELNSFNKNSRVNFRYVMTADWFDEQSSPSSGSTINFPYNLPNRKFLVLKVYKPVLYIEITIQREQLNPDLPSHKEVKLYYKYDLKKVEYTNVGKN